jgi:hypothetical protein
VTVLPRSAIDPTGLRGDDPEWPEPGPDKMEGDASGQPDADLDRICDQLCGLLFFSACVIRGAMPATKVSIKDDRPTLIAISSLACILQDVLHEGLGHGVTAWMSGAHIITMSTVVLQSDRGTRWISANGTLVNLVFGALFWLLLLRPERYRPTTRYFLVLAMAGNLFTGTGYFLFSGILNFGDWATVIRGWQPPWMWRIGMVGLGALSYYASMMLVATSLRPFQIRNNMPRLRALCWTPYFTDGILASLGGLLNPLGLFYVIASALPSTFGANASLLGLPAIIRGRGGSGEGQVAPLERNVAWIGAAAVASLLFIFVLGRGITWSR